MGSDTSAARNRYRLLTRRSLMATALSAFAPSYPALGASKNAPEGALAFRDEVLILLRRDFPDAPVSLTDDPEEVVIGRFTLYLGNLRRKSNGLIGIERRAAILDYLRPLATAKPLPSQPQPAESFADASKRLRIQLVPNEYEQQAPLLTCRPFSKRLLVAYVLDEQNRYQMVTRPIFESWGVDQQTVEEIAKRNLELASGGVQVHISPTGKTGRFATLADESGYAAASLLLPMVMDQIQEGLRTPSIIAAVPTRDILIAWSSDSEEKARLANAVTSYASKGPYSRSTELFSYSRKGLRPLNASEMAKHGS